MADVSAIMDCGCADGATHADYRWVADPAGNREVGLHPACNGCPLQETHGVPWRFHFTAALRENPGELPVPAENVVPAPSWYRAVQAFIAMAEYVSYGRQGNAVPGGDDNDWVQSYAVNVVSASGSTLTVTSSFDPRDFSFSKNIPNPDYPGMGEPEYLTLYVPTRVQTGDMLEFSGNSVLALKCKPRVVSFDASGWVNAASEWTITMDQPVDHAATKLSDAGAAITATLYRYAIFPVQWAFISDNFPLYCTRRAVTITAEDVDDAADGEVELLDSAGDSCRVAWPEAASGNHRGTFKITKTDAAGAQSDITAAVLAAGRLRVEHVGGSGHTTLLSCGDTIDGTGGATPLIAAGETLRVEYEPEWVEGVDSRDAKRSPCQSRCAHSVTHHRMGSVCGLAGRQEFVGGADTSTDDPPNGLASFRADCYQWRSDGAGTCADFQARDPFDWANNLAAWMTLIHNSVNWREREQTAGVADYVRERLGVPSLGQLGGRRLYVRQRYGTEDIFIPEAFFRFISGSGASKAIKYGGEWDHTAGLGGLDLTGTIPGEGVFGHRTHAGKVDGLSRAWNSIVDPYRAARDNRRQIAETTQGNEGTSGGRTEGRRQRVRTRWAVAINVDVSGDDLTVQDSHQAAAQMQGDGSLLISLDAMELQGAGGDYGTITTATITAAVMSGTLVRLEFANKPRTMTSSGGTGNPPVTTNVATGGMTVMLPAWALWNDLNDAQSRREGGVLWQGGIVPGDTVRFSGVGGANAAAIEATGFVVSRAIPCEGTDDPVSYPGGWAGPANFASWIFKRDRAYLFDRGDGLLAANLADLVGATATIKCDATLAPSAVHAITVEYRESPAHGGDLGGDEWTAIDAGELTIDEWAGHVLMSNSFIAGLDAEKRYCFRVTAGFLDRTNQPYADIFLEVERMCAALDTVALPEPAGGTQLSFTISRRRNLFANEWGLSHTDDYAAIAATPDVLRSVSETAYNAGLSECSPGWFVSGDSRIDISGSPPGNIVATGVEGAFAFANLNSPVAFFRCDMTSVLGWDFELTDRIPAGTTIAEAKGLVRFTGLTHQRVHGSWTAAVAGAYPTTIDDSGTVADGGNVKLSLFGLRKRPDGSEDFPVPLGVSATITPTSGTWQEFDFTDLMQRLVDHLRGTSPYYSFAWMVVPAGVSVPVSATAQEAAAAHVPTITYSHFEAWYSGCSMGSPVLNPTRTDQEGELEYFVIGWSGLEIERMHVTFGEWPAVDEPVVVDGHGNNWPRDI